MVKLIFCALIIIILKLCASDGSECGKIQVNKSTPLIVNGEPAYHGQFPWLAPLFHSKLGYICGSSIISEWHLLTAAHCVDDKVANKYHALVGRFDLKNSSEFYWKHKNISTIYAHEDFNISAEVQRSEGDIAVLRVKEKIKYTPYIQPICLPDESTNIANRNGMAAGYGKTEILGDHQNTPSYVHLKTISNWKCGKRELYYANIVSEKSFCAGDPVNETSIPCQGDSGGAFLVHDRVTGQHTILGIVSFSIGLCNPKDYVAFSDVTQYIDWINETIEFDKILYGESSDPCESVDCGDKGECQIINGKTECACLPQYSGTYPQCGLRCSTNDDCPDDRKCLHNVCTDLCLEVASSCVDNAECRMKNHRTKCECMDGYEGNGYFKCEIDPNYVDGRLRYDDDCDPNCKTMLAFDVDDTRAVVAEDIRILPKHRNESVELLNINGTEHPLNSLPVNVGEVFMNLKSYRVKNQNIIKIKRKNFVNLNKLEQLEISENDVDMIVHIENNALNGLTELRILQLSHTTITNLPENIFDNNQKLEIIDLNSNYQISLNLKHFQNLIELKSLNLANNKLVTLPENIFMNLNKLEKLDLNNTMLKSLPKKLFENLTELKFLSLYMNELQNLHENTFIQNSKLEFVSLSSNEITSLGSEIFKNLMHLNELDLSGNQLTSLPEGIFQNTPELKLIKLTKNWLTSLPVNIFQENLKLEEIYWGNNKIPLLSPAIFQNSPELKILDLSGNQLTSLPDDFFNKNLKLEEINLSYNGINSLSPAIFQNSPELKKLNLMWNHLTSLSEDYFKKNLKLEKIYLSYSKISALNSGTFQNLKDLRILFLSGNQLTSLSADIFEKNLKVEEIYLSSVGISSLSSVTFQNLKDLKILHLDNNQLTSLPGNIFENNLKLEEILLNDIKISSLSSSTFQNLKELKRLSLNNNQLTSLPGDIFENNPKLAKILLGWNKISSLNSAIFDNQPNLTFVFLKSNICIDKVYGNFYNRTIFTNEQRESLRNDLRQKC